VLHIQLHHLNKIETHLSSASCHCSQLSLKDFVFGEGPIRGTTPLILACKNGELGLVKHLIEIWRVNVNATAKYFMTKKLSKLKMEIEKASPLFVASVHGHNHIVRYLLGKGAEVSVKTSNENLSRFDGLTPLYGAVSYNVHFDSRRSLLEQQQERHAVVLSLLEYGADPIADAFRSSNGQPMWRETMCGVDTITALIHHGLDLKRRIPGSGKTLLHYVVASLLHKITKEDSLAIVKLLVEKGADLLARDIQGFTPLLTAANHEQVGGRLNLVVLDFLLERTEYSRMEKIEAMELSGATILLEPKYAQYFPKAFDYWNHALHLRHQVETTDESSSSSKKILGRKIGSHVEWTTFAELHQLMLHPEDYRIQALLVKLRILSGFIGYDHYGLSNSYVMFRIMPDSTTLEENEKFTQILDIIWGRFDVMIRHLDSLRTERFFWILVEDDVHKLIGTLSTLQSNHPSLLNFEKIKTSLDLILLATDKSHIEINSGVFCLLEMIFHLPGILEKHETASLTQSLRQLGPHRLGNLLLLVCRNLSSFEALALVRVLLEAGADPNVVVDELLGNTLLHVAAGLSDRKMGDVAGLILIEFGAKLHRVNKAGKTALDIWIELNETKDNLNEALGGCSARPEWCCPLRTLLRLAARVIRVHKLPYADGNTPVTLHSLIELR